METAYKTGEKWFAADGSELKTIRPWQQPESWFGKSWNGWFVGLSCHRDSDTLAQSNYEVFNSALGALPLKAVDDRINDSPYWGGDIDQWDEAPSVYVVRESHWAVGWVEWVAIHGSDTEAMKLADKLLTDLGNYPVLDEEHWSNLEYDQINNYWCQEPLKYRIQMCRNEGLSIFAARQYYPPREVFDTLQEGWL